MTGSKKKIELPFKIINSQVSGGFIDSVHSAFTGGIDVVNYHEDKYGNFENSPLQSPFTEHWVGGKQHRHVSLFSTERPEAFHTEFFSGGVRFYSHKYLNSPPAYWSRDNLAKSPLNLKNIQTTTSSLFVGNYSHNYEVVQSSGRRITNNLIVDGFEATGVLTSQFIFGQGQYTLPELNSVTGSKSIIVERFNAPGSKEESSRRSLDREGEEMSPNSPLPFRNVKIRQPFCSQLSQSTPQFGGTIHGVNRNRLVRAGNELVDNGFVVRSIPSTDIQYTWITASSTTTAAELGGYQSFGDSYNGKDAYDDIDFITGSLVKNGSNSQYFVDNLFVNSIVKDLKTVDLNSNTFFIGKINKVEENFSSFSSGEKLSPGIDFIGDGTSEVRIETSTGKKYFVLNKATYNSLRFLQIKRSFIGPSKISYFVKKRAFYGIYDPSGLKLERADSGEDLLLQYSTNGTNWQTIKTILAGSSTISEKSETVEFSNDLPYYLRFAQPRHSGQNFDNYAITDIDVGHREFANFNSASFSEITNSPYTFTTWTSLRGYSHPVAKQLKKNNLISVQDDPGESTFFSNISGERIVAATKRAQTYKTYIEPPVTYKYKPLSHRFMFIGTPGTTNGQEIVHTYTNNLSMFANKELNTRLSTAEDGELFYNTIYKIYLSIGKETDELNPFDKFLGYSYSEVVWPREQNTGLAETRKRISYVLDQSGFDRDGYDIQLGKQRVFWREEQENRKRSNLSDGGYYNSFNFISTEESGSKGFFLQEEANVEADNRLLTITSSFVQNINIDSGLFNSISLLEQLDDERELFAMSASAKVNYTIVGLEVNEVVNDIVKRGFTFDQSGEFNNIFVDFFEQSVSEESDFKMGLGTLYRSTGYKSNLTSLIYDRDTNTQLITQIEDEEIVQNPKLRYVSFIGGGEVNTGSYIQNTENFTNIYSDFASDLNGPINAIAEDDNYVYLGGSFSAAKNAIAFNIVRYRKKSSEYFDMNGGIRGEVKDIIVDEDTGEIYIVGLFDLINWDGITGNLSFNIAKWNGANWENENGTNGIVNTIIKVNDSFIVGGNFTSSSWNGVVGQKASRNIAFLSKKSGQDVPFLLATEDTFSISPYSSSFGLSVAMSSDANRFFVASPAYDGNIPFGRGAIQVFSGSLSTHVQTIIGSGTPRMLGGRYFYDNSTYNEFGKRHIDVNDSGTVLIAGAPQTLSSGETYIFESGSSGWTETYKMGGYGDSVVTNTNGNLAASSRINSGQIRIIESGSSGWSTLTNIVQTTMPGYTLSPLSPLYFGQSLSMNSAGTYLAIGAPGWRVLDEGDADGSVFIWDVVNGVLAQQITSSLERTAFSRFGSSVSVNYYGDILVIGAPEEKIVINGSLEKVGAVYIFESSSVEGWQQSVRIEPKDPVINGGFGSVVEINKTGDMVVVGVPELDSKVRERAGEVFIYTKSSLGDWIIDDSSTVRQSIERFPLEYAPFYADALERSLFGASISVSHDNKILVGAPHFQENYPIVQYPAEGIAILVDNFQKIDQKAEFEDINIYNPAILGEDTPYVDIPGTVRDLAYNSGSVFIVGDFPVVYGVEFSDSYVTPQIYHSASYRGANTASTTGSAVIVGDNILQIGGQQIVDGGTDVDYSAGNYHIKSILLKEDGFFDTDSLFSIEENKFYTNSGADYIFWYPFRRPYAVFDDDCARLVTTDADKNVIVLDRANRFLAITEEWSLTETLTPASGGFNAESIAMNQHGNIIVATDPYYLVSGSSGINYGALVIFHSSSATGWYESLFLTATGSLPLGAGQGWGEKVAIATDQFLDYRHRIVFSDPYWDSYDDGSPNPNERKGRLFVIDGLSVYPDYNTIEWSSNDIPLPSGQLNAFLTSSFGINNYIGRATSGLNGYEELLPGNLKIDRSLTKIMCSNGVYSNHNVHLFNLSRDNLTKYTENIDLWYLGGPDSRIGKSGFAIASTLENQFNGPFASSAFTPTYDNSTYVAFANTGPDVVYVQNGVRPNTFGEVRVYRWDANFADYTGFPGNDPDAGTLTPEIIITSNFSNDITYSFFGEDISISWGTKPGGEKIVYLAISAYKEPTDLRENKNGKVFLYESSSAGGWQLVDTKEPQYSTYTYGNTISVSKPYPLEGDPSIDNRTIKVRLGIVSRLDLSESRPFVEINNYAFADEDKGAGLAPDLVGKVSSFAYANNKFYAAYTNYIAKYDPTNFIETAAFESPTNVASISDDPYFSITDNIINSLLLNQDKDQLYFGGNFTEVTSSVDSKLITNIAKINVSSEVAEPLTIIEKDYSLFSKDYFNQTFSGSDFIFSTLDNGLIRTAEADSGKRPFFDSYDDFIEDVRSLSKEFSIIPEFRISDHLEYYIKERGGDFRSTNKSFLSIDGIGEKYRSAIAETESYDTNFITNYSTSDLLKKEDQIKLDNSSISELDAITIKITGIKKLLPYNGFYPQQRTSQLANLYTDYVENNLHGGVYNLSYYTDYNATSSATAPEINKIKSMTVELYDDKYHLIANTFDSLDGEIYSIHEYENYIYVGGNFTKIGNKTASYAARLEKDSATWEDFGWNRTAPVTAFAQLDDKIIIGDSNGQIASFDTTNNLITYRSSLWGSPVNCLTVSGSDIFVGSNVALSTGSYDAVILSTGPTGVVKIGQINALTLITANETSIQSMHGVWVGGSFSKGLTLWNNGISDPFVSTGINGAVRSLYFYSSTINNGLLFVGGNFSELDGSPGFNNIAVLKPQAGGSIQFDNSFGGVSGTVHAIGGYRETIYFGSELSFEGRIINGLTRANSGDINITNTPNATVRVISNYDYNLIVGGDFTRIANHFGEQKYLLNYSIEQQDFYKINNETSYYTSSLNNPFEFQRIQDDQIIKNISGGKKKLITAFNGLNLFTSQTDTGEILNKVTTDGINWVDTTLVMQRVVSGNYDPSSQLGSHFDVIIDGEGASQKALIVAGAPDANDLGKIYFVTGTLDYNALFEEYNWIWSEKQEIYTGQFTNNLAGLGVSLVSCSSGYQLFFNEAYGDNPSTDIGNVYVCTSSDGATSWSTPIYIATGTTSSVNIGFNDIKAINFLDRSYVFFSEPLYQFGTVNVISSSINNDWGTSSVSSEKTLLYYGVNSDQALNVDDVNYSYGIDAYVGEDQRLHYVFANPYDPITEYRDLAIGDTTDGLLWKKNSYDSVGNLLVLRSNYGGNTIASSYYYSADNKKVPVFFTDYSENNVEFNIYSVKNNIFTNYNLNVSDSEKFYKHASIEPMMAPGILYNTIKSGIAVDWPCATGSNTSLIPFGKESIVNSYYPKSIEMYVYEESLIRESMYGHLRSNIDYRIPFENLLFPNEAFITKDFLSGNLLSETSIQTLSQTDKLTEFVQGTYIYGGYEPYTSKFDFSDLNTSGAKRFSIPFVYRKNNAKDTGLYSLAMSNFLGETVKFFLKDEKMTTFTSEPDYKWKSFDRDKTYYMDIVLEKTPDFVMMEAYHSDKHPLGPNGEKMHGRYFGYPVNKTSKGLWTEEAFTAEESKLIHNDPAYAPYTPPYFEGEARVRISFKPLSDRNHDLQEIFNGATVENIFLDVLKGATADSDAHKNKMPVGSSVEIFGTAQAVEVTIDERTGQQTVRELFDSQNWVISPKMETPVLNFASQEIVSYENEYSKTSGFGRGMWSGYGEIPSNGTGVRMRLEYPFTNIQSETTASLLDQVGFKAEETSVGELADKKMIKEGFVLVPYLEESNSTYTVANKLGFNFIKINKDKFYKQRANLQEGLPAVVADSYSNNDYDIQKTSISHMIEKMQEYVIPPEMDFLQFSDISPFVMYIMEFEHVLDKQDLADIWQGLMPKISYNAEIEEEVLTHKAGEFEFFEGKPLPDNLRWLVFKVKKKAEYNYFNVTSTTKDDSRFNFNKIIGRTKGTDIYSYNWPYDYFSLVEFAKVELKLDYKNKEEEET